MKFVRCSRMVAARSLISLPSPEAQPATPARPPTPSQRAASTVLPGQRTRSRQAQHEHAITACGIDAPGDVFHQWMGKEKITPEAAGNLFPIGRTGKADELTAAVLFLCSVVTRLFLLQVVQLGLAGLMDGSVSSARAAFRRGIRNAAELADISGRPRLGDWRRH